MYDLLLFALVYTYWSPTAALSRVKKKTYAVILPILNELSIKKRIKKKYLFAWVYVNKCASE